MAEKQKQELAARDPWTGELEYLRLVQLAKQAARHRESQSESQSESYGELPELVGTSIGPWHLRSILGGGGMGVVYAAEQTEPMRRDVALKVIKPGMDSREVIHRFQSERQALAMMDHPNIASVIDAGATETGLPFFVMELIRGVSINRFCDEHRLTINERLELFQQVCLAVQHAHQKGIIHRDLKPSNILVTEHDGHPVPKVIDFGVAKAINAQVNGETAYTRATQILGTPMYMSPEQAALSGIDIDTRSDIYSLGVVLYELLTGCLPFSRQQLEQHSFDEVRRMIREVDPARPSERLRSLDPATQTSVAADRNTQPGRLIQSVRGDLDWIVMKALEKDRTRRYQTPFELAEDLKRLLNDEPVSASPPTRVYRMKKFARKNRVAIAVAGLLAGILLTGIAGTSWGWIKSLRSERLADERLGETELARKDEQLAKEDAIASAKRSTDILDIVMKSFKSTDPKEGADAGMEASDVLDNALTFLQESNLDHLGQVTLLGALAKAFHGIGDLENAVAAAEKEVALRREAAVSDPAGELYAMTGLGMIYHASGKYDAAAEVLEPTYQRADAELGIDHATTAMAANGLAATYHQQGHLEKATELYLKTLDAIDSSKQQTERRHLVANNLARVYIDQGKFEDAIPLLQESIAGMLRFLKPDAPDILATRNNLALAYQSSGRIDESMSEFESLLPLFEVKLGADHPATLGAINNMTLAMAQTRNFKKAIPLQERLLSSILRTLGEQHPHSMQAMGNLARSYSQAGRFSEAIPLIEKGYDMMVSKLGEKHPQTLNTLDNLATTYQDAGRVEEAIPLFQQALAGRKEVLGDRNPRTLTSMNNLAAAYWRQKQLELSIPIFEELLMIRTELLGRNHLDTTLTIANLAINYCDDGRFDEGIPLLEEVIERDDDPNDMAWVRNALLMNYRKSGRVADYVNLAEEDSERLRLEHGPRSKELAGQLAATGHDLLRMNEYSQAESRLRQSLDIREVEQPNEWSTFNVRSLLGAAVLGQDKLEDARPLLISGFEGLEENADSIPESVRELRLREAAERLLKLAELEGNAEEITRWTEIVGQWDGKTIDD